MDAEEIEAGRARWQARFDRAAKRDSEFRTLSGLDVAPVYGPAGDDPRFERIEWSCGSVFTNPPGDHAARLIDTAGLKGFRVGGARVSEMHANFIVNDGTASAADIEHLIEHVMTTVERTHGVKLNPEVRVVGEVLR